jgi:large subunit ribosomal protein L21
MYSVIECGGFQHKVTVGETLKVPKMDAKIGDVVKVSNVLLFADGGNIQVGAPLVSGAAVTLEVLNQGRADKVISFKRRQRKRYRKTKGHRQHYTEVLVTEIASGSAKASVDEKAKARARARIKALEARKVQQPKPTRAQKIAAAKAQQA